MRNKILGSIYKNKLFMVFFKALYKIKLGWEIIRATHEQSQVKIK